ncbi:MAG: hypothetical protein GY790_16645 [Bacteroidetes bacterium]|nr:hypothetical protein [Bacteroidota bacterium]
MMKKHIHSYLLCLVLIGCVLSVGGFRVRAAHAQSAEQTITLNPGWNAVFLEVEPHNNSCDDVFQGIPVESVWMWNPDNSLVEYIQNPDELVPESPQWLTYFPTGHPLDFMTDLFTIQGERVYFIKLTGATDVNWTIIGRPLLPKIAWTPYSLNLVGFHLAPGQEPTFADFFAPSEAHGNTNPEVYRLNPGGEWEQVTDPQNTPMQSGEAYWVKCNGKSDYPGPITVQVEQGGGLDYGRMLVEQKLYVRNNTTDTADISLTPLNSSSNGPAVDGAVPLHRWIDPPDENAGWNEITGPVSGSYEEREGQVIRLAVQRASLPGSGLYQSLLAIENGAGVRILAPVSAEYQQDYAGLWVGSAIVNNVNQPSDSGDPDTPKPTASEFQFRLILHVDSGGQKTLLREVTQMWQEPQGEQEGYYVLITDESLIPNYSCPGLRDGRPVCRRVSSPVFSFPGTLDLSGSFSMGNVISGQYPLGFDDPLNPFKHKYHPDHDNLYPNSTTIRPEGDESYDITRNITMEFTSTDPTNLDLTMPGWGDTDMGGTYTEQIIGLHRDTLYVEGVFRLHKVSTVGILNDGP